MRVYESDYLSAEDLKCLSSVPTRNDKGEDPLYMTVELLGRGTSGKATAQQIQQESEYMTLTEVLGGRLQEQVEHSTYLTLEDLRRPSEAGRSEEPGYLSIEQLQALSAMVGPEKDDRAPEVDHDTGYATVEEMRALAQEFEEKIHDMEPDYLSIEDMQALAGPEALAAWIKAQAADKSVHSALLGSTTTAGFRSNPTLKLQWLTSIRDNVLLEILASQRRMEVRDAVLARRLQMEEYNQSHHLDAGDVTKEEENLVALERLYLAKVHQDQGPNPKRKKRSLQTFLDMRSGPDLPHTLLGGEKMAHVSGRSPSTPGEAGETQAEPDFDAFEAACVTTVEFVHKTVRMIEDKDDLRGPILFYFLARIVKHVQFGLDALHDIGDLDLGHGITKGHIQGMNGHLFDAAKRCGKANVKARLREEILERLDRLGFLLDKVTFEEAEGVEITDPASSVKRQLAASLAASGGDESWACSQCATSNISEQLYCLECGFIRGTSMTAANQPRGSKSLMDSMLSPFKRTSSSAPSSVLWYA